MFSASIAIEKRAAEVGRPGRVAVSGSGENTLILWRFPDGTEVIETNGDPVWDADEGFCLLKSEIEGDRPA